MSRAIINPAPIKILDEPTASLDPLSESNLYSQFEKIIDGKTSIFISHRLGSIKLADEIIVFEEGELVEQGSHAELICREGIYCELYKSQMSWYQKGREVRS
jgi:ATP-binding cassette subfamily B protein